MRTYIHTKYVYICVPLCTRNLPSLVMPPPSTFPAPRRALVLSFLLSIRRLFPNNSLSRVHSFIALLKQELERQTKVGSPWLPRADARVLALAESRWKKSPTSERNREFTRLFLLDVLTVRDAAALPMFSLLARKKRSQRDQHVG